MRERGLFGLEGKVALVTGSTKGIGLAIARRMAEAGAKLIVSSRKPDSCDAVVEAFKADGLEASAIPCNVSRMADIEALAKRAAEPFGPVDVLVCNAAINIAIGPLGEASEEVFDKTMAANVKSVWRLTGLLIPAMAEKGGGSVIAISSIAALRGTPLFGLYSISKTAEMALVRSLAVEWGPSNVRVNAILPGLIKTDLSRALWENPEIRDKELARTPLGRLGEPDDIAGVAVFLASDAGRFVTGQAIVADGGQTVA